MLYLIKICNLVKENESENWFSKSDLYIISTPVQYIRDVLTEKSIFNFIAKLYSMRPRYQHKLQNAPQKFEFEKILAPTPINSAKNRKLIGGLRSLGHQSGLYFT